MRTILKSEDFQELVVVREYENGFVPDKILMEHEYHSEYKGIKMNGRSILLDGVLIEYNNGFLPRDSSIIVEQDTPHLEMHVELSGNTSFVSKVKGGMDVNIHSGSGLLFYFPELKGKLDFAKSENRSALEIEFSLDFLRRIFSNDLGVFGEFGAKIEKGLPAVFANQSLTTTPRMKQVIFDIINCQYKGILKKVYLESKVVELLSMQIAQHIGILKSKNKIQKEDVEKLHYAKELVVKNIQEPCSLLELAEMTGLNDFKLKKGFKELFGHTVFGYLNDIRMEEARNLILSGNHSIADVSERVGYKNPQHFTVAFKKKFGILPKDLKG